MARSGWLVGLLVLLLAGCAGQTGQSCDSDAACDPGDDCIAGVCSQAIHASAFSVTPASANTTTPVGQAPPAVTFALADSTKSGHAFAVSCDGGATPAPASGKVSAAQGASIKVQAAAPTAAGTTTVTCQVTCPTVASARATFSLAVQAQAAGSFTIAVSPASVSASPGSSAAASVTLTAQGGWARTAALSTGALPAGVTAAFSPAQLSAGQTAALALSVSSAAAAGNSSISVQADDGAGGKHTAALGLQIGGSTGGAIGPSGGTVDLLDFVLTGDTRPPNCDENSAYPTALHTQIVAAMGKLKPQLGLDLGDHMYVCQGSLANAQLQMGDYLSGLKGFPAYFAMTMGNHECESSDCSGSTTDVNYTTYLAALKQVSQQASPNYALQIQTRLGRVTLVVVADDSFSSADQAWLQRTLTDADASSKYTIIAKHHPAAGTRTGPPAPGQVIAAHKYSLLLAAHNHDYEHTGPNIANARQVICGLGGANSAHTGFCRVQQAADGTLHFTQYDIGGNPGDTWSVGPQ